MAEEHEVITSCGGEGAGGEWSDLDVEPPDAHLIASAPDLYEALAEIMAEGAVVRDDLVAAAHAALAKARGES